MNKIIWRSPSNIALIKYWGKTVGQIPSNPSISFSLQAAYTETILEYSEGLKSEGITLDFLFEGKTNLKFQERISLFIHSILQYFPVLNGLHLHIESENSFPHSSGIASSASAMSALALCLVSLEKKLNNKLEFMDDFHQKASFIARVGSGSASRSIYGGYTLWGTLKNYALYTNEYAVPINEQIHPVFKTYGDAVLMVSQSEKQVSSSAGHRLMEKHPFAKSKFSQSNKNTHLMLEILEKGEQLDFILLTEVEALSLHAMMMTSNPSYLLMEPNTLALIQKIRQFRRETLIPAGFTLDARANVHFIYPELNRDEVLSFVQSELLPLCQKQQWIDDKVGSGPVLIKGTL